MAKRSSVLHALELLRSQSPGLTVTQALLFLYVAENAGITMSELASIARLRLPTASRAARGITAVDAPHSLPPHADLLDVKLNPANGNSRIVDLSSKGRLIAGQVMIAAKPFPQRKARTTESLDIASSS